MKIQENKVRRITTRELVTMAFLSSILLALQIALAPIPNVEVVSLLIYIYTQIYRKKAFFIIYVFALLEGCVYGFGIWWVGYLYVWSVLSLVVLAVKGAREDSSAILCGLITGAYGLIYGFLFAIPYFVVLGWDAGTAYWIAGIPFDLIHCVGNVAAAVVLYKPLRSLLGQLNRVGN